MRTAPLSGIIALALLVPGSVHAQNDVIIQNHTYTVNQNETVSAINTIATNIQVTVEVGATVTYEAGAAIYLRPNFKVKDGAAFHAIIKADADGDGMPDAWEIANQLNPNDAADAAQHADSDGLTNLQEYLLGTNPRAAAQSVGEVQIKLNIHQPVSPLPQQ